MLLWLPDCTDVMGIYNTDKNQKILLGGSLKIGSFFFFFFLHCALLPSGLKTVTRMSQNEDE